MQKGKKIMWILIMTMHIQHNMSIATAEFNSEQACRYAGASQEVAFRQDLKLRTDGRYTFICVPKDE